MGFHLYCIVPAGVDVPGQCAGLGGRRPLTVAAGRLAVWAAELDAPPRPDIDAMRAHNDVVMAALSDTLTPVPIRFGQWCDTLEDAAARVAQREEHWASLLERFAGRAEYGARVLTAEPDTERDVHAAVPESGRDYMAELAKKQARTAARRAEGERLASAVSARLGELVSEQKVEPGAGRVVVSLAHLVAWSEADEYHVAMREVRDMEQDTRWVLSGPWPPYSFVE